MYFVANEHILNKLSVKVYFKESEKYKGIHKPSTIHGFDTTLFLKLILSFFLIELLFSNMNFQ